MAAIAPNWYADPVTVRSSPQTLVEVLRTIAPLQGLTDDELRWLVENGTEVRAEVGQVLFHQGEPANTMVILLQGEIQVRRRLGGTHHEGIIGRSREITGVLPYSRMVTHGGDGTVTEPAWALAYPRSMFPEMLRAIPEMGAIATAVLLDRVREITRLEQQTEKLAALNQLAGNLAHELNNPASAAQRSATHLRRELRVYGQQKFSLGALCLDDAKIAQLRQWEEKIPAPKPMNDSASLEAAERDTPLLSWLEQHGVQQPWELSSALAEVGITIGQLDELAAILDGQSLGIFLAQFASARRTFGMTESILSATGRIFRIIDAIKDYAYLDQAPMKEMEIPQALHTALAILRSRLEEVEVVEDFPPDLPAVTVYPKEMNQVWMALLDNALDAMSDHGRLELRACADSQALTVEIIDDGPGIPAELRARVFEPFFSTKGPGPHLGLGLDTVTRIVRTHRGTVKIVPLEHGTCMQVRLPLDTGRAY